MKSNNKNFIVYKNRLDRYFYGVQSNFGNSYTKTPSLAKRYKTIRGATNRLLGKIESDNESDFINEKMEKISKHRKGLLRKLKLRMVIEDFTIKDLIELYGKVENYNKIDSDVIIEDCSDDVVRYIKKKLKDNKRKSEWKEKRNIKLNQ